MEIGRPIFWHQGLFLQPQHFQFEDRFFGTLLSPYFKFSKPYLWGVAEIELPKTLSGNTFEKLHSGEFLFPDMSHIVFPGNAVMSGRSFDESVLEEGKPVEVYLGLKKWDNKGGNVTVLSNFENLSNVSTRFVASTEMESVNDMHQEEGPPANLKRLYYVLKLFWEYETERLGDYALIPISKLEKVGDDVVISDRFVPPCLSVHSSPVLKRIIKEVKDQISARGYQLESYKKERGIHSAEFGSRDMVYLLALRSLNRYIPALVHSTETTQTHPWSVYGLLRQLIGELSSFSESISVTGEAEDGSRLLPNYDHSNLWTIFSSAQALVTRLLDDITAGPDYILPLLFDGTFYVADLQPQMFEGGNRFYLVLRTDLSPEKVIKSLENIAKVSSREDLPIRIARALPGVRVDHLSVPPQELPRRADSLYFELNHHSDQWAHVEKGRNIGLYWDSAPEDLKVEMMIVGRS